MPVVGKYLSAAVLPVEVVDDVAPLSGGHSAVDLGKLELQLLQVLLDDEEHRSPLAHNHHLLHVLTVVPLVLKTDPVLTTHQKSLSIWKCPTN